MELIDFEFSVRTENALRGANIFTLEALLLCTPHCLKSKVRSFGQKCLNEVRDKLALHGYALAGEVVITSALGISLIKEIPLKIDSLKNELVNIKNQIESLSYMLEQIQIKVKRKLE